jgi:hypothetical protein
VSAASGEPSAAYLASQKRWRHEFAAVQDGLRGKPLTAWLLPVLYVHRNALGAWKILSGKK